jgi:hypothetical protein
VGDRDSYVCLLPHIEGVLDHALVGPLLRVWEGATVSLMNGVLNREVPVSDGSTCAMLFIVVDVVGVVTVMEGEEGGRTKGCDQSRAVQTRSLLLPHVDHHASHRSLLFRGHFTNSTLLSLLRSSSKYL